MKRRRWSFLLLIIMIFAIPLNTFAGDAEYHDEKMRQVLFGEMDSYYKKLAKGSKQKQYIEDLQYASYLCVDFFNGAKKGQIALESLSDIGVPNLPANTTDSFEKNGINYTASGYTHRGYTHKGWDYDYSKDGLDGDKANWKSRKVILQNTVKTIFDGENSKKGFLAKIKEFFGIKDKKESLDPRYNSLAAVIYYVHILGDQIDADENEEGFTAVPFVMMNGKGEVCIVDELEKHFSILFNSQIDSAEYKILIMEMDKYKVKAEKLYDITDTPGGLADSNNFEEYRSCEEEFIKMLSDRVPKLLQNEDFFSSVFEVSIE